VKQERVEFVVLVGAFALAIFAMSMLDWTGFAQTITEVITYQVYGDYQR